MENNSKSKKAKDWLKKNWKVITGGAITAILAAVAIVNNSNEEKNKEVDFDEGYDDEDDDGENLSVWDVADIYFSNGCDEDYSFGYTHEELEEAYNE